jgi:hypothetical protein
MFSSKNPILALVAGLLVGGVLVFAAAPSLVSAKTLTATNTQYATVTQTTTSDQTLNGSTEYETVVTTTTTTSSVTGPTNTTTGYRTVTVSTLETTTQTVVQGFTQTVATTSVVTSTQTYTYTTYSSSPTVTTNTFVNNSTSDYVFQSNIGQGNTSYYYVPPDDQLIYQIQLTPMDSSSQGFLYWHTYPVAGVGDSFSGQVTGTGLKMGFAVGINPDVEYAMVVNSTNEYWQISIEVCGLC